MNYIKLINMKETIQKYSAFDARTRFGELLDQVRYSKKPCFIERHGKPVAALIDIKTYQRFMLSEQYRLWIHKAVQQIIEHYQPEKIVLFGSTSIGAWHEGSDIDLLIVKETSKRRLDRSDELLSVLDPDAPLELHIYTPQELRERLDLRDFFISEIVSKGQILYERKAEKIGT